MTSQADIVERLRGGPQPWDIHVSVVRRVRADRARDPEHQRGQHGANLATGKTLRDGPVKFFRRHFYEKRARVLTIDTGLMVNVHGHGERLIDAGRAVYRVLPDGTWDVQELYGPHPVFEALDGNRFIAALGAFCGVLD